MPHPHFGAGRTHWVKGATSPLILIGIGGLFLVHNFGFSIEIGRWWPLLLVLAGLGMLFDRIKGSR